VRVHARDLRQGPGGTLVEALDAMMLTAASRCTTNCGDGCRRPRFGDGGVVAAVYQRVGLR
jgi:hypothetical protein